MKKILIVEDDILAAELERDYLEASDYEVELCCFCLISCFRE